MVGNRQWSPQKEKIMASLLLSENQPLSSSNVNSGLLSKDKNYLYGTDAIERVLQNSPNFSPANLGSATLMGLLAPIKSPFLDVDATSDDVTYELAIPDIVRRGYQAVMSPVDVASGRISPSEGANRALEIIGVGGLLSPKPRGSLGIFGGRESATAPTADFMIAERMADRGINKEKIYRDTGIYLDPVDKQMKYEISDDTAKLSTSAPMYASAETSRKVLAASGEKAVSQSPDYYRLKGIIDHPEFFKAYPKLADTPVTVSIEPLNRGGAVRVMKDGTLNIQVAGKDLDEIRSILLHEMQHLVQRTEKGFGQGGNPETSFRTAQQGLEKKANLATDAEINARDMARKESGVLSRVERILKNEDITPRPRLLTSQGDWYKYGDDIRSELGPMPKRSGPKQKEWIKAAGKLLAQRQLTDDDYYNANELNSALLKYRGKLPELKKAVRRAEYKFNKLNTADVRAADEARYRQRLLEMNMRDNTGSLGKGPFLMDIYRRLAGEVEARDVQKRRDMTKEERREKSPTQTRDVRADQTYMTTNPTLGLLYQQNPYQEDSLGLYRGGIL